MSSGASILKRTFTGLGLEAKFVILAAFLSILGALAGLWLIYSYEQRERRQTMEDKARILIESMAISFTHTLLFEEIGLVEESGLLDSFIQDILLKSELDVQRVMVFNAQGKIIAHNDFREYGKTYDDVSMRRALTAANTLIQDYEDRDVHLLDIATPLQISYKRFGTLRLVLSLNDMDRKLQNYGRRLAFLAFAGLCVAVVIAAVVARTLAEPIKRLAQAMQDMKPDFQTDLKPNRSDEIGYLQRSFLDMVDRLNAAVQEQRRIQNMLIHADRLASLGTMAAGVAHEMSSPLTGIRSCVERIERNPQNHDQIHRYTGLIMASLDRAEKVVRGMLDFARYESIEAQPVNLQEVLEEVVALMEHRLHKNHAHLETHFASDAPEILGDRFRIGQVFLNLMLNAVDAMTDGGTLKLACISSAEGLIVTVADTGCGISEQVVDRIFDPFYTTKGVGEGTGLGLSIAHGIVKEHGGHIQVESELGKGTTFRVFFPFGKGATT